MARRRADDTPSLSEQQAHHNEDPENASNALYDTQPRAQSNTPGTPAVHRSRPAPDKAQWESHYEAIGLTKHHTQNMPAAPMGNAGWNNIYNLNSPQHPATPLTNANFAAMAMTWADAALAWGSSPQSQIGSAVSNLQTQLRELQMQKPQVHLMR